MLTSGAECLVRETEDGGRNQQHQRKEQQEYRVLPVEDLPGALGTGQARVKL